MEMIEIKTNDINNLVYTIPQGITGDQFMRWKEANKDLIAKAKENVGGIIKVEYKG